MSHTLSHIWDWGVRGTKRVFNDVFGSGVSNAVHLGYGNAPQPPDLPNAPTIGNATLGARQQDEFLRRRRGVLANMTGGASGGTPTTGSKQLLGQ